VKPVALNHFVLQASNIRILGRQLGGLKLALNTNHRILRLLNGKAVIPSVLVFTVKRVSEIVSQKIPDLGQGITLDRKELHPIIQRFLESLGLTFPLGL
jgi:hypothetical protein